MQSKLRGKTGGADIDRKKKLAEQGAWAGSMKEF